MWIWMLFRRSGDARQSRPARYPYCIGGSRERRGVISTANYPARNLAYVALCRQGWRSNYARISLASGAL